MLKLIWKATHPGAPNTTKYKRAVDTLFAENKTSVLQTYRKPPTPFPAPSAALKAEIDQWVAARGPGRVVVLVHGYSYNRRRRGGAGMTDDPFDDVYSTNPAIPFSWVPIVGEENAVAFSWTSAPRWWKSGRACWTNRYEYAVYDVAIWASQALATVIAALGDAGLTVDVFAHSLGTRVTVKALGLLAAAGRPSAVRRAVMLGGAEYSIDAWAVAPSLKTEFYSFVINGDPVLQWGASELGGRLRGPRTVPSRVIGRDGMKRTDRWIDLQLDHKKSGKRKKFADWFQKHGYALSGKKAGGRGLHGAYYMHAENRRLFADILANDVMGIPWFKAQGAPDGVDRFRYGEVDVPVPETPMTCKGRKKLYD